MKLECFNLNKDTYKLEIEKLLIYYKVIYRIELDKIKKLSKHAIINRKDKMETLATKIKVLRQKISTLDMMYRFINKEPFTIEQLRTITTNSDIINNEILAEVAEIIKEKLNYIEELDLQQRKKELEKEIYIEELTSNIKTFMRN